jgi:hypothetical protein
MIRTYDLLIRSLLDPFATIAVDDGGILCVFMTVPRRYQA